MSKLKASEWDASYQRGDNRTFWPLEEVVRFLARHVVKRIGPNDRVWRQPFKPCASFLDFGCGAGRHLKLALELGFDAYGVDLSGSAVQAAKDWLTNEFPPGVFKPSQVLAGPDALETFCEKKFDVILAASCLDSMYVALAREYVTKFHQMMVPHGRLLFDVISGDETGRPAGFCGELIVHQETEKGTIQSYYNRKKIDRLIDGKFRIIERILLRTEDDVRGSYSGRFFVACARMD